MCDVSLALSLGGSLFSAFSQMQQANAQADSATATASNNQKISEYNAKVADNNNELEQQNARDSLQRGAEDASVQRDNYRKATGTARAAAASSGLLVDTGSFGALQDQNTTYGELNALTAANNAEREAYGFKLKGMDFKTEAINQRFQGQVGVNNAAYQAGVIRQGGLLNAASTLVTGGAGAYDKYIYRGKSSSALVR